MFWFALYPRKNLPWRIPIFSVCSGSRHYLAPTIHLPPWIRRSCWRNALGKGTLWTALISSHLLSPTLESVVPSITVQIWRTPCTANWWRRCRDRGGTQRTRRHQLWPLELGEASRSFLTRTWTGGLLVSSSHLCSGWVRSLSSHPILGFVCSLANLPSSLFSNPTISSWPLDWVIPSGSQQHMSQQIPGPSLQVCHHFWNFNNMWIIPNTGTGQWPLSMTNLSPSKRGCRSTSLYEIKVQADDDWCRFAWEVETLDFHERYSRTSCRSNFPHRIYSTEAVLVFLIHHTFMNYTNQSCLTATKVKVQQSFGNAHEDSSLGTI